MTQDERTTIEETITYLDDLMVKTPSRELADASNFLQNLLDQEG